MFRYRLAVVAIAFLLDMLVGDPEWRFHPIRLIGNFIYWLEQKLRPKQRSSSWIPLLNGTLMVIVVLTVTVGVTGGILYLCYSISSILGVFVEGFLGYTLLATKSLKVESMKVYEKLVSDDIEGARYAVSRIVGRDTSVLDQTGITKAAVETIAENTSDGSIAPMLFLAFGGAPLGFFYKAVNTMDSMVGYKNEKNLYFGRCAAKLDDVVNYLPARLSALFMIVTSYLIGMDGKQARKIYFRDRRNHASPNSAQTESVCAGALRVQLAGNAYYFGKLYEKPTIGDPMKEIETEDIRRANRLLYGTAILCFLCLELILLLVMIR